MADLKQVKKDLNNWFMEDCVLDRRNYKVRLYLDVPQEDFIQIFYQEYEGAPENAFKLEGVTVNEAQKIFKDFKRKISYRFDMAVVEDWNEAKSIQADLKASEEELEDKLQQEVNNWIIDRVLPISSDTTRVRVELKKFSGVEGDTEWVLFEICVEEEVHKELDSAITAFLRLPTTDEDQAKTAYATAKRNIARLVNVPVVGDWSEPNPLISELLPKYKLVKFVDPFPKGHPNHGIYPFKHGERAVMLGELEQMPGHCIVLHGNNGEGKLSWGYHTDNFVELTDDEV